MKTFEKLTSPLNQFLESQGSEIDRKRRSKSLFFADFTLKMIYALVMQVGSLRLLVTELETSQTTLGLGFCPTPYSTLRDGFYRFSVDYFKKAFLYVLNSYDWKRLTAIDEVGMIKLVDGSLFPTLACMHWATYKKNKNAVRLHLEMDLNRMIPTEFLAQKANSSERSFLLSILKQGYTYVADRGYFSFKVGDAITKAKAFFVIRIKSNLKFRTLKQLSVTNTKGKMPECFGQITDRLIQFDNDGFKHHYRLVCFTVLHSQFFICTNRFGLTTLQIIMLYAYRWQIELMFKFLKRTLKGIHLFNHSENGVKIHCYLLMITALLQLRIMQLAKEKTQQILVQKSQLEDLGQYVGNQPEQWIAHIAKDFYKYWKVSVHAIRTLRNYINQNFDEEIAVKLAKQ